MATFTLTINTDNAAFEDGYRNEEIESCLKKAIASVAYGELTGVIQDSNGNKVGTFQLSDD